jgi:two-component system, cell cycle response regulator DivK
MNEPILIVDDNIDNLELTQILLEGEGFEVRLAEDAETALKTLQTYRPRLILMDVQLPGMDGLELTRRLRQNPALQGVIIVALSAYAMKSDEDNAREAGCDGYITKPINTRTFVGAVRGYLDAPHPTLSGRLPGGLVEKPETLPIRDSGGVNT